MVLNECNEHENKSSKNCFTKSLQSFAIGMAMAMASAKQSFKQHKIL